MSKVFNFFYHGNQSKILFFSGENLNKYATFPHD